jgi:RNase P subunit RPR2
MADDTRREQQEKTSRATARLQADRSGRRLVVELNRAIDKPMFLRFEWDSSRLAVRVVVDCLAPEEAIAIRERIREVLEPCGVTLKCHDCGAERRFIGKTEHELAAAIAGARWQLRGEKFLGGDAVDATCSGCTIENTIQ